MHIDYFVVTELYDPDKIYSLHASGDDYEVSGYNLSAFGMITATAEKDQRIIEQALHETFDFSVGDLDTDSMDENQYQFSYHIINWSELPSL